MKKNALITIFLLSFFIIFQLSAQNRSGDEEYYQAIQQFNLFRPLGWQPPSKGPKYELLATKIPENGLAKALIRESVSNKIYYVGLGDEITSSKVVKIESSQVSLNQGGKVIDLSGSSVQFLRLSGDKGRKEGRRGGGEKREREESEEREKRKEERRKRIQVQRKMEYRQRIQETVKGWSDYFRGASRQAIMEAVRSDKFRSMPEEARREVGAAARSMMSDKE
ncbi:hypothetical protein CMK13_13560 [Candidatus Poribacteria bacterium]|nr:hypothetical protein [Candidatus Poribacteria bacterium]OUT58505.1 MAG: hypothetical protein CBB75_13020 [bacterium TMED15]